MSYTIPNSFYDTSSINSFETSYTLANQFGSQANAGAGGSYYFPPISGEPSPAHTTYNGVPLLPTPLSLPGIFSTAESEAPLASAWSQSPDFSSDNLSQLFLDPNAINVQPQPAVARPATRRRGTSSRRTTSSRCCQVTGKVKKPARAGCATQLQELPVEVQQALEGFYDCCAKINSNDSSTLSKHRLSNLHFKTAARQHQAMQPTHACPAFLGMHFLCKSAKPGRFDAGKRHCNTCPGFKEMVKEFCEGEETLIPVEVTRGEFEAVLEFRRNAMPGDESNSPLVMNAMLKVGAMVDAHTRRGWSF